MRQKRKSRAERDSLDGVSAKGEEADAALPAQCALPRMLGANRRAEMERLMTLDEEAEIERLLDDLTTILLEAAMLGRPGEVLSEDAASLSRLEIPRKRRRCGEA